MVAFAVSVTVFFAVVASVLAVRRMQAAEIDEAKFRRVLGMVARAGEVDLATIQRNLNCSLREAKQIASAAVQRGYLTKNRQRYTLSGTYRAFG